QPSKQQVGPFKIKRFHEGLDSRKDNLPTTAGAVDRNMVTTKALEN
ncbi:MAG: hypothetical protein RLZZ133_586, partial [Pseudomonadota bacterium]